MACRTGCTTQDHESYAACLRDAGLRVAYCNSAKGLDYTAQKRQDADLAAYRAAREQGIQPASTARPAVERAVAASNKTGRAYDAS